MSLFSALSAAITPANQAVNAFQQGRQDRQKAQEAESLRMLDQLRKAQEAQEQGDVRKATLRNIDSQIKVREAPRTPPVARTEKGPDGMVYVEQPDGSWKPAQGMGAAKVEPKRAPATRQTARGVENWNEATGKYEVEMGADGKPVMPYQAPVRVGSGGPTAAERSAALRSQNTFKTNKTTHDNMKDAIATYRKQLEASGVEVLPGTKKSLLESAYSNMMLQGKEVAKLGVLAGPDMGILERLNNDPTSKTSGVMALVQGVLPGDGRATSIKKQLDQYEEILDGYIKRNKENFGPATAGDDATTAADRWEALVAGGMSKAAATAQVKREFPDG